MWLDQYQHFDIHIFAHYLRMRRKHGRSLRNWKNVISVADQCICALCFDWYLHSLTCSYLFIIWGWGGNMEAAWETWEIWSVWLINIFVWSECVFVSGLMNICIFGHYLRMRRKRGSSLGNLGDVVSACGKGLAGQVDHLDFCIFVKENF